MGKRSMAWAMAVSAVLACCLAGMVFADEKGPTAELSVLTASHYIWRGQELSRDSLVVEPGVTVGYKGFSANLWSNLDTDPYTSAPGEESEVTLNETDLTLSYAQDLGPVSLEAGYIYYGLDGIPDTQEVYAGVTANVLLSPSLKVYKDVGRYPSWYFLLGVSHSFAFNDAVSLELSGSVSYLASDSEDDYPEINDDQIPTGGKFSGLHDGVVTASLPIAFAKYFTVSPAVSYTFPLGSDAENEMQWRSKTGDSSFFTAGLNLSMAF